jgi:hypothetical protein
VVPNGYNPPILLGAPILPAELFASAVANAEASRGADGITGGLLDQEAMAVPGAVVSLSGTESLAVVSSFSGRYSLPSLQGGGDYTITPSHAGCDFDPSSTSVVNLSGSQRADFAAACLPAVPTVPFPVPASTIRGLAPILSWHGSRATSHDVFFGTSTPPPFAGNTATNTYEPGALVHGATYYWRVESKNVSGTASSPTWTFTALKLPSYPTDVDGDGQSDAVVWRAETGTGGRTWRCGAPRRGCGTW